MPKGIHPFIHEHYLKGRDGKTFYNNAMALSEDLVDGINKQLDDPTFKYSRFECIEALALAATNLIAEHTEDERVLRSLCGNLMKDAIDIFLQCYAWEGEETD